MVDILTLSYGRILDDAYINQSPEANRYKKATECAICFADFSINEVNTFFIGFNGHKRCY